MNAPRDSFAAIDNLYLVARNTLNRGMECRKVRTAQHNDIYVLRQQRGQRLLQGCFNLWPIELALLHQSDQFWTTDGEDLDTTGIIVDELLQIGRAYRLIGGHNADASAPREARRRFHCRNNTHKGQGKGGT